LFCSSIDFKFKATPSLKIRDALSICCPQDNNVKNKRAAEMSIDDFTV